MENFKKARHFFKAVLIAGIGLFCTSAHGQTITTFAGSVTPGYLDGSPATTAAFQFPHAVATDAAGNVYVADQTNHVVRKISTSGVVSTFAGNNALGSGYTGDNGPATDARLSDAFGIVADAAGNVYFSDHDNQVIRKVDAAGTISTIAGNNTAGAGFSGDNGPATDARINNPTGIVIDGAGNIYFAEAGSNVVRKVDPTGTISTYAGLGLLPAGYFGDNGPATAAIMSNPEALAIDAQGNIYVADFGNFIVRKIDATTGIITTIAGTIGTGGNAGNGGPATAAVIGAPYGLATDRSGNVYIADQNNALIKRISKSGIIDIFAGTAGVPGYSGDTGPATSAEINAVAVATDNSGNVYLGDFSNHVIRLIANQAPAFVTSGPTINICQDAAAYDFAPWIAVNDLDPGQVETWTVTALPAHGTLSATSGTAPSGVAVSPIGFTYTPNTAFHGTDAFTVMVDDGNGGVASVTLNVTVNPTPVLTNTTTPTAICNNNIFSFTQTGTDVATYTWGRAATPHITAGAASGVGNINELLTNDTAIQVPVTYTDTLTSIAGCVSIYNLIVTVNPTPLLYPAPLVGTICDGATFGYTSTSRTPSSDISYSWSRATYPGNPGTSGIGAVISEPLVNHTNAPFTVDYIDTLRAYGCTNLQTVQVIVNPTPTLTSTLTPHSVCDSALFRYLDSTQTIGVTGITWTRASVPGIANLPGAGSDSVKEYLDNTTDNPIPVNYVYTLMTSGSCSHSQTFTVFVNPTPHINTTLTPASICDSTVFHYIPLTSTIGATIAWTRPVVANISPATGSGGPGDVNELLHNTGSSVVPVTYIYTTTIDGCSHSDNVVVSVNPKPRLSNTTTSASPLPTSPICNRSNFSFTPTSATAGTVFTWSRAFVSGIGVLPGGGTGSINDTVLKNNTNVNVDVVYVYTLSVNGCSATQSFNLTVHPTPVLITKTIDAVCSGVPYTYQPKSLTPDVTYAWSASLPTSLTATSTSGTGDISTVFTNQTTSDKIVNFAITLKVGTNPICSYVDTLKVTVQSIPTPATISTTPNGSVCAGALYQNFGASNAPAAGTTYEWSATNATVWATGNTGQYAIINFTQPGTSVVTLSAVVNNGCKSAATYSVTVGAGSLDEPYVIYTSSHFVCLQSSSPSFQWGYDDAGTLDSTILTGYIDQSYFLQTPDFGGKHYWVITKSADGCYKKSYYNAPTGINDFSTGNGDLKVYPNPASNAINVEVNSNASGNIRFEVVNMLGQKVSSIEGSNNKTVINVANLPAGYYIVDCYISDLKTGTAKFIKN